ncbi:MAG: hypothetical protein HC847_29980 [Hydrococcus sp. RU_2_2]|nr:hypothetical protein [Hydrococcus sp. RU_2_2]
MPEVIVLDTHICLVSGNAIAHSGNILGGRSRTCLPVALKLRSRFKRQWR